MSKNYEVIAVEIATGKTRVMKSGLDQPNAEAYADMAAMRRGCEREIFSGREIATNKERSDG